jgi:hypothetical protein
MATGCIRPLRERTSVNSLYVTRDARDVRALCPQDQRVQQVSDAAHAIVSEPLDDLAELWIEVPARDGGHPRVPAVAIFEHQFRREVR